VDQVEPDRLLRFCHPCQEKQRVFVGEPKEGFALFMPELGLDHDEARLLQLVERLAGGSPGRQLRRFDQLLSGQAAPSGGKGATDLNMPF